MNAPQPSVIVPSWHDCRTESERQAALALALGAVNGNRTEAAKLLKMNRGHLQDRLAFYARIAVGAVGTVGRTDSTDSHDTDGAVGPSVSPALTCWLPAPSFHRVETVEAVETAKMTFEPPKHLKDWLERKALERKQASGGRFAVSPVIVEILEARMREEQEG
jgi:hypothetical protein